MKNKEKVILIFILVLAFSLRVWGIGYGLPNFFVGDEQSIVGGALRMAELKTLIPAFHPKEFQLLYYPPLLSYIYLILLSPLLLLKYLIGGFSNLSEFKDYLVINPAFVWLIARLFIALLGTASVYLVYLLGKKIFKEKIGLLAGLFLAVSFFQIELSHFARHWIPACFFTLLLAILAFELWQNEKRKYFVFAGLVGGLAFGITYVTSIAFLLPIFSYFFLTGGKFWQKIKNKNFYLMIGIFLAISLIFIALYPQELLKITVGEDTGATAAKSLSGFLASFYYYFLNLLYFEPIILFFSLAGAIFLFLKNKKILAFLLFYPFIYIILFYFLFHNEVRYTLLIVPFLALIAAYFVDYLLNKLAKSNLVEFFIILAILIYPLAIASKINWLLSQKDTRVLVKEWLEKNVAENSKIITDVRDLKIIPSKDTIKRQQELAPESLRTIDRTLLNFPDEKYPHPFYDILDLHFLSGNLPLEMGEYAKSNNYQYFIVSYWQKSDLPEQDQSLVKQNQPILKIESAQNNKTYDFLGNYQGPVWKLFEMQHLGPIVEVYKL